MKTSGKTSSSLEIILSPTKINNLRTFDLKKRLIGLIWLLVSSQSSYALTAFDGYQADVNAAIYAIALQNNGKALIGGSFTDVNGESVNRLSRLNQNGSTDTTFDAGIGPDNTVSTIVVLDNQQIIIAGEFTSVNGFAITYIARLNADGSVDTSFGASLLINDQIRSIQVLDNGKILVAGDFTEINSLPRAALARLNADGSLDTGFIPDNIDSTINTMAVKSDGSILIGGDFLSIGGTNQAYLAQLSSVGQLDEEFVITVDSTVNAIALLRDDSIIVGGAFTTIGSQTQAYLAKLDAEGGLVASFAPVINGRVIANKLLASGQLLVSGEFTTVDAESRAYLARLEIDGSIDTTFELQQNLFGDSDIFAIAEQSDSKLLLGGKFFSGSSGTRRDSFFRTYADGVPEFDFNVGSGLNSSVYAIAKQADGKIIIGGDFTQINGIPAPRIARLNEDGTVDTGFDVGTGFSGRVYAILVLPDGKILIGGSFRTVNKLLTNNLARLNTNGSVDTSYNVQAGGKVQRIIFDNDGKILVGGQFQSLGGHSTPRVGRLNSDGSADTSFTNTAILNLSSTVFALGVQADGKVIAGGNFRGTAGANGYLLRMNSTGSLDTDFCDAPCTGPNLFGNVLALKVLSDDKVLIGGDFTSYNGTSRNRIAKLNADGTLDTSFDPGIGANDRVYVVDEAPNGDVLVAGDFTDFNNRNSTVRFHQILADGSHPGGGISVNAGMNDAVYTLLVEEFSYLIGGQFTRVNISQRVGFARLGGTLNIASGLDGSVLAIGLQDDYKVVLVGNFSQFAGLSRNNIVRLNQDGNLDTGFDIGTGTDGIVTALSFQPDGKILITGTFTEVQGEQRNGLARLLVDGSLDPNFIPPDDTVLLLGSFGAQAMAIQVDGKILLGGALSVTGTPSLAVVRLLANGSIDPDFSPIGGMNDVVNNIIVQPDGKIVVGGWFSSIGSTNYSQLARFNADGTLDLDFADPQINKGGGQGLISVVLLRNGKFRLSGSIASIQGQIPGAVAQLDSDGTLDTTYSSSGVDGVAIRITTNVKMISSNRFSGLFQIRDQNGLLETSYDLGTELDDSYLIQPDGKLIVAADFTTIGGANRGGLARLEFDRQAGQVVSVDANSGKVLVQENTFSPLLPQHQFEVSLDSETWLPLTDTSAEAEGLSLNDLDVPVEEIRYVRVRSWGNAGRNSSFQERVFQVYRDKSDCSFFVIGGASKPLAVVCI